MLSIQLWVEGDDLGALNLYSYEADAFTDESENIGLLVASHAAVAFAEAEKIRQLQEAVDSRDVAEHLISSGELPGRKKR